MLTASEFMRSSLPDFRRSNRSESALLLVFQLLKCANVGQLLVFQHFMGPSQENISQGSRDLDASQIANF